MAYPAIVVANEIIKLAKSETLPVSPMKLQKILYLANGVSYKRLGEKLIKEKFEAWDYGPVINQVYHTFKDYRGGLIPEPVETHVHTEGFNFVLSSSIAVDEPHMKIIKEAWDNSKNLSAITLSAWSHNKSSPWDKAYNATPRQVYISDEDIQTYFNEFIQE